MSSMSSLSSATLQVARAPRPTATDADGDNDGSKSAAAKPAAPAPQFARPTATLGNLLDTHA